MKEIYSAGQIACRVRKLGETIAEDYRNRELLAVCILKGAFIFFADLVRCINTELQIDFVRLSSYGNQADSSGNILITRDIEADIRNKNILLVEDIVDTGLSLSYLSSNLRNRGASEVKICALVDKRERRRTSIRVDYSGFTLQKGFLVGYGLDIAEKYRNLPGIYEVDPDKEINKEIQANNRETPYDC